MKVLITFRRSFLMMLFAILLWPTAFAQSTVTGTVIDNFGEPIAGASVVEKGTTNGIITDFDGNFSLKLQNDKNKIAISYVGMVTKELVPTPGKNMKVELEENNSMLEDVVVLGYTSKARKDLTGSVGSVSGGKLEVVPVASASVALQGKISGVQVTTVDGQPGADVNIRIRGGSSITQTNEPLYIVDGFQQDNINDIPPADIQSIDILKDASLTAIYGAKGSNGVVIVTTKSAQAGKVKVSLNANVSVSQLSKKLDLMNAQEFATYQYQWHACDGTRSTNGKFYRANFGNPYDLDMYSTLPTHDWQDEVMGETPVNYATNINIGGGGDKVKFNLSVSNSEDKGIIMGSGVRRTNLNLKTDIQVSRQFSVLINQKFNFRRDEGAGGDNVGTGGIIDVLKYRPTNGFREFGYIDPSYADPNEEELFNYTNPKSDIAINQLLKHTYNYSTGVALDWKPIKGLVLRSEGTFGFRWSDKSRFYGHLTDTGKKNDNQPVVELTDENTFNYLWTNTASYSRTVNEDHNLSFLLGQEIKHSQKTKQEMVGNHFSTEITARDAWTRMARGDAKSIKTTNDSFDRMASFFGKIDYNFDHKYLLSFTARSDGSTKFAKDYRWGFFPSVSGAWVLSQEKFLEYVSWIDQLKLRMALGRTGNNGIDSDKYLELYVISNEDGPAFGENTLYGELHYQNDGDKKMFNRKVKWETSTTRNLAVDWTLFGGRLTVTPEFYWNTIRDLLYKSDLVPIGYESQIQNIAEVTSKGIELSITGDIVRGKDYVISGFFNFGMNKRKIDKLNGVDKVVWDQNDRWKSSYNDYCLKVGDETGLIYGFVYDGLYSFDEFYFDPQNNYTAIPWGSSATDNGTSNNCAPRSDGYVTVINDISGESNSGKATLPGKPKFKDLNGDGRITEEDRTVIGNTNPRYQGGFGFNGQYKDWDFTINFTYMLDFDINNATAYTLSASEGNKNKFYNVLAKFNNGWQYNDIDGTLTGTKGDILYKAYYVEDCVNIYKNANANRTLWNPTDVTKKITHSYFVEDGSFVRCSDLTVGYTLPNKITKKAGISKVRFYASASNLFIITNYSGYDPEVDIQTGLTCGMDYNRYPRSRSYVFGTNITF